MFEYIFVTNIFEYSNIRIYSSHSDSTSLELLPYIFWHCCWHFCRCKYFAITIVFHCIWISTPLILDKSTTVWGKLEYLKWGELALLLVGALDSAAGHLSSPSDHFLSAADQCWWWCCLSDQTLACYDPSTCFEVSNGESWRTEAQEWWLDGQEAL